MRTRGQGSPLGQPHHGSHRAVKATTDNAEALEKFGRKEVSLSHLGVQIRCYSFPSRRKLAFRQELCLCLGSAKG